MSNEPERQWRRPGGDWQTGNLPLNEAVDVRRRDPVEGTFTETTSWSINAQD